LRKELLYEITPHACPVVKIYYSLNLAENRITSADFLKIDVDGPYFQILNSIGESFDRLGILGRSTGSGLLIQPITRSITSIGHSGLSSTMSQ